MDIKIGLPYTHLQREIWNRPRERKWAMLLCVLARNEVDRKNGHSSKKYLLSGTSQGKLKLANSCWQTQVGVCERHKNSRQTRWQTVGGK